MIKNILRKKNRKAASVSVIRGADGPISVYVAIKSNNKRITSFKQYVRRKRYQKRKKAAASQIVAAPHTLDELIAYVSSKYPVTLLDRNSKQYRIQKEECKYDLVQKHRSDLIGGVLQLGFQDVTDSERINEFWKNFGDNREKAIALPDEVFPMDYQIFKLEIDGGTLNLEIEKVWNVVSTSCTCKGTKKQMQKLHEIQKDIFLYYGVSDDDIEQETERYQILVNALIQ